MDQTGSRPPVIVTFFGASLALKLLLSKHELIITSCCIQSTLKKNLCFFFACAGSLLLCWLFSHGKEGLLSTWGARASHCSGFSCWGAWTLVVGVPGL